MPKRANFINIQQSHVIATLGAMPFFVSTGYDRVIGHTTDDIFTGYARGPGKVTSVTDTCITVKYDDPILGTETWELGPRYGVVTGHTVKHILQTDFKEGMKFNEGQILAYNKNFFRPDWMNPGSYVMQTGPWGWVTFMENSNTFEDACLISVEHGKKLHSEVPDSKVVTASFMDDIVNLVQVGDTMEIDDPYCYITKGSLDGDEGDFSQAALDNLRNMGADVPRAGYKGVVGRIEVFYFGDKEDMSPSIRKLVSKYDSQRMKQAKQMGPGYAKTGEVIQPVRIKGQQLEVNMIAIVVHLDRVIGIGDGDKIVVGNQAKSVISGYIDGLCQTENPILPNGEIVKTDTQFSYRAEMARIIPDMELIGFVGLGCLALSREAAQAYFKG